MNSYYHEFWLWTYTPTNKQTDTKLHTPHMYILMYALTSVWQRHNLLLEVAPTSYGHLIGAHSVPPCMSHTLSGNIPKMIFCQTKLFPTDIYIHFMHVPLQIQCADPNLGECWVWSHTLRKDRITYLPGPPRVHRSRKWPNLQPLQYQLTTQIINIWC